MATVQVAGSHFGAGNTGATRYGAFMGGGTIVATEAQAQSPCPTGITVANLRIKASVAPGAAASGKSWTVTLYKNGSSTGLTATILETATTSTDLVNTVTVAAGDTLTWEILPANTPAASRVSVGYTIVPDTSGQTVMMAQVFVNSAGTHYEALHGSAPLSDATEADIQGLLPTPGTFSKFYVKVATAPGGVKSWTFAIFENTVTAGPTVTIVGAATTGSDTSTTLSSVATDLISILSTGVGTPSTTYAGFGCVFTPDTAGESVLMNTDDAGDFDVDCYFPISVGDAGAGTGTEINTLFPIAVDVTGTAIYAQQNPAPGAGGTRVYRVRDDIANSGLECTIADAATTGNTTGGSTAIAAGSLICIFSDETAEAAAATRVQTSVVFFITPTAGGIPNKAVIINQSMHRASYY